MKEFEYFKINSIEELKKAYNMFEDRWTFSLKEEIKMFNKGFRCVRCNHVALYLGDDKSTSYYNGIKSPVRNINNLNKLI